MKQNIFITIGLFALIVFVGVATAFIKKPGVIITPSPSSPNLLALGVGQTGKFQDLTLRFNTLVNDYRCPIDVQCIEAGAVNTNVTLASGGREETRNLPSDEVPYQFNGYKISIETIAPPLTSGHSIPPMDYVVTFRVEKL